MLNKEKLKQHIVKMNAEELAEFFYKPVCYRCIGPDAKCKRPKKARCLKNVITWMNNECDE